MGSPKGKDQEKQGRGISTIGVLSCLLLLGAVALFCMNIYSHQECQHKTAEELEEYIQSINKRLLEAESENIKNSVLMDKVLHLVQTKLGNLEREELERMMSSSQDAAVKISLSLASQPAPPLPHFYIDPKYADAEKLADVVDTRFTEIFSEDSSSENAGLFDQRSSSELDDVGEGTEAVNDEEAYKKCVEWRSKYNVILGESWGTLPYDLQTSWKTFGCDYHLTEGSSLLS